MTIIVGLGNPGNKYQETRHNTGFLIIDRLGRELGKESVSFSYEKKWNAQVGRVGGVLLVKPQTYMNDSGSSIKSIMDFYKAVPKDIWVVHDDMDLPLGKIRIREKGGSAGHKGIESIIEYLKTDAFVRFRLGIGRGSEPDINKPNKMTSRQSVIHFVLSRFNRAEAGAIKHLVKRGAKIVSTALFEGIDKAMDRYN